MGQFGALRHPGFRAGRMGFMLGLGFDAGPHSLGASGRRLALRTEVIRSRSASELAGVAGLMSRKAQVEPFERKQRVVLANCSYGRSNASTNDSRTPQP